MTSAAAGAMPDAMERARYTSGAIWFHWAIAALIIANLAIGLFHESLSQSARGNAMDFHKAAGIVVLLLSVARLGWRLSFPPPRFPGHLKRWEAWLARWTHRTFYLLMIGVPLAGWLFVSASPKSRPFSFFGLFDLPRLPVPRSESVFGLWHEAHELLAFAMLGLVVLHVAGALKHQLLDRDNQLARMGLGRSAARDLQA